MTKGSLWSIFYTLCLLTHSNRKRDEFWRSAHDPLTLITKQLTSCSPNSSSSYHSCRRYEDPLPLQLWSFRPDWVVRGWSRNAPKNLSRERGTSGEMDAEGMGKCLAPFMVDLQWLWGCFQQEEGWTSPPRKSQRQSTTVQSWLTAAWWRESAAGAPQPQLLPEHVTWFNTSNVKHHLFSSTSPSDHDMIIAGKTLHVAQ